MKQNESRAITETKQDTSPQELQLVSGPRLLEILFDKPSRPTLRWLRDQQKARTIPFTKVGRLVFFIPAQVRLALMEKQTVRARGGVR